MMYRDEVPLKCSSHSLSPSPSLSVCFVNGAQRPVLLTTNSQQTPFHVVVQTLPDCVYILILIRVIRLVMYKRKDKVSRSQSLAKRCKKQLEYSRFRAMNEFIYSKPSDKGFNYMNDLEKFKQYHEAYDEIACKWPVKPVDYIVNKIESYAGPDWDKSWVIADLGCGQYPTVKIKLPKAKVHSFDIISHHKHVTAANMSSVPLKHQSVDIAVYSLSLMATNIKDLMVEANRILKKRGMLMIAEVASRFEDEKIETFEGKLKTYGFQIIEREYLPPNNFFVFINAIKKRNLQKQNYADLPEITLKPCLYKPR